MQNSFNPYPSSKNAPLINSSYPMKNSFPLVSADWLAPRTKDPAIVVLDATFFLPNQKRSGYNEYLQNHIPGSLFFDIDKIADQQCTLPHMLPTPKQFAESVENLGIGNKTHVVVYDNNSFMASARVWWTFRVFGHNQVSVLDGGLKRWKSQGMPLEQQIGPIISCEFTPNYKPSLVRNIDQVLNLLESTDSQILDARPSGRFKGLEKEPREGLRSGHIPNSLNLHFLELVDRVTGQLISQEEMNHQFAINGLNIDKPVVTTCGSGVTASILALALFCIGKTEVPVYDGSWSEWGARSDTPVAKNISE